MLRRAFSLCAVLGMASVANAGAVVTLTPSAPVHPDGFYHPGDVVRLAVSVQLDANSPATVRTRLLQFDLSDSNPDLVFTPVGNHPLQETQAVAGPIPFWSFSGSTICAGDEASCGGNYFVDGSIAADDILNITYTGLTSSGSLMIVLRQASDTVVGLLDVTIPDPAGKTEYLVDVLNADETDVNLGAELRWGFGSVADPTDPNSPFRANGGGMTGGQVRLAVVPEPATLALLSIGGLAAAFRRRSNA